MSSQNLLRILGVILIAVGIILLVFGINSTHQFGEEVTKTFSGQYTETTRWYIIGGVILLVGGIGVVISAFRKRG